MHRLPRQSPGFTIVELLVVIIVIGIIAGLSFVFIPNAIDRAQATKAETELNTIAGSAKLYARQNDDYPNDVSRDIPAEIKEFISDDMESDGLPKAPWPDSVYDYDAWDLDEDGHNETVQISIRFCPVGGQLSECNFPEEPWAENMTVDSAYYYCIKGYCRSNKDAPVTTPGYCVNCSPHDEAKRMPSE